MPGFRRHSIRKKRKRTLELGIALAETLPETDRVTVLGEAISLAGTVSPQRAFQLATLFRDQPWRMDKVIYDMLSHGHVLEAATYLSAPPAQQAYPFSAAREAMRHCRGDVDVQRGILRGAMSALRDEAPWLRSEFLEIFTQYWTLLPVHQAADFVRKFVSSTLDGPDQHGSYRLSSGAAVVRFSSTQQFELFRILGPLRELDPELAESLIAAHPQLAKAAAVFPNGFNPELLCNTELTSSTEQRSAPAEPMEWDNLALRHIPVSEWMKTCFEDGFAAALRLHATDTAIAIPNAAVREVWPSTQEFRTLLYKAGRYEGRAGTRHLERVPDPDLRLFAKIELAAALAGLPQVGGASMSPKPPEGNHRV